MIGSAHRANNFAGRIFALHAGDRLEECSRVIAIAFVVGVDANPVHVAAEASLLLADDRDVVFRLAGQDAVVASHTLVEIDRHTPGIGLFFILVRRIERGVLRGLRLVLMCEVRILLVFVENRFADQRTNIAVGRLHGLHALRGG